MRIKDGALLRLLKLRCDECEITGETGDLHLHHVIFKSQGGDDVAANIVCCHGRLHDDYHRGKEAARKAIGSHVSARRPDTVRYLAEKLGSASACEAWLERHLQEGEGNDIATG
jgi:5-methylcytosine-specific restriction endonuclease McrA